MERDFFTRRTFLHLLKSSASKSAIYLSLPTILSACQDARKNQLAETAFRNLSQTEALEFDAIAERILPATDSPGAREAGVRRRVPVCDVPHAGRGARRRGAACRSASA